MSLSLTFSHVFPDYHHPHALPSLPRKTSFFNVSGMMDHISKDQPVSDSSGCIDDCTGQPGKSACKKCDEIRNKAESKTGPGAGSPELPDLKNGPANETGEKDPNNELDPDDPADGLGNGNGMNVDGMNGNGMNGNGDGMNGNGMNGNGSGINWPPCVDGFMARGPVKFSTTSSPSCQKFNTHGMIDQCGSLGVEQARLLSCTLKDSVAITGERGVYYMRDGKGKQTTQNMEGWVNCPVPKDLCPEPWRSMYAGGGNDLAVGGPNPMHSPGDGLWGQFIPESDAVTIGGFGGMGMDGGILGEVGLGLVLVCGEGMREVWRKISGNREDGAKNGNGEEGKEVNSFL